MDDPAKLRVFINYRREDTAGHAGRLHDSLAADLQQVDVFMDVGDIEPGADFTVAIADAIRSCDVMLALIGPRWTTATTIDGRRRLDDPDDHVVSEIAAALDGGVWVIPVLIDGAAMPNADVLPHRIAGLARRNAVDLASVTWQRDLEEVVAALRSKLPAPPSGPASGSGAAAGGGLAPPGPGSGGRRTLGLPRWVVVGAAIAVVLLVAAIAAGGGGGGDGDGDGDDDVALAALELRVDPASGPPGTTFDVYGGPCPRPSGWASVGEVYFGIYDPRESDDAVDDLNKGEVDLRNGFPWHGQLTIPDDADSGPYGVYANCWADNPDGEFARIDDYRDAEFFVE